MLFGVLFEEREFADRSKQLLAQLVAPYVKAALIDLRMFQFTTHPARMLLSALAESLEGNRAEGVHERALQKQVESVVQRLLAGFKLSISVFPKLEKEFREYLVRHRQRLEIAERRSVELQSGQERLENARAHAEDELRARLGGRTVPASIREFFERYWTHHLTMVMLRETEQGDAWRRSIATADRLLGLLTAGPGDVRRTLADLEADLQEVLQSSGVMGDAARHTLAGLTVALLSRFVRPKAASSTSDPTPVAEASAPVTAAVAPPQPSHPIPVVPAPASRPLPASAHVAFLDDQIELTALKSLKLGDWIELSGDDGKSRPLKLSWVSPISSNMVFVNRHGVRVLVASPQELVALRQQGKLLLHSTTQLFDHAMNRIRDRLEAQLQTR